MFTPSFIKHAIELGLTKNRQCKSKNNLKCTGLIARFKIFLSFLLFDK